MNIPKGWHIERNLKPIPTQSHDYDFWHDDYDGADGGNGLCGTAASIEDAIRQIEEIDSNIEVESTILCERCGYTSTEVTAKKYVPRTGQYSTCWQCGHNGEIDQ